jgi:RNA polymerase sigma factor for flagellar operon FliA
MVTEPTPIRKSAETAWKDRDAAIKQYLPLVKHVVARMPLRTASGIIDTDDLISHGNVGLIQAIDRYDPSIGIRFETYALSRIRGAILDAIRAVDCVPRAVRLRSRHIDQARTTLMFELGRNPTDAELQAATGLTRSRYDETMRTVTIATVCLDEPKDTADSPEGLQVSETVCSPDDEDITEDIERQELREMLVNAVKRLPPRELYVIKSHYDEEMSFKDISEVLGVSAGRAGQLHAQALHRLQRWVHREQAA